MKAEKHHYLIIGAGPLGQVFGTHLARSGHCVLFLVKPEHQANLVQNGITILNPENGKRLSLEEPQITTHVESIEKKSNYSILLCVRSEQLESTFAFLKALPAHWPIICFQPGFEDTALLKSNFSGRTILQGNPGFSAFSSNGAILNKTSRLFPTLVEDLKRPQNNLSQEIVDDLNAAKLPARLSPDVAREIQPVFAFAIAFLLGLEYHGFHLISLLSDHKIFSLSHQAAQESAKVICQVHQIKPARLYTTLFRLPTMLIRILMQLTLAAPDSHQYQMWSHHGPKIRQQSLAMAKNICALGDQHALPVVSLKKLINHIEKLQHSSEANEAMSEKITPPVPIRTEQKR